MKQILLTLLIAHCSLLTVIAQQHRILSNDIASLEVMSGNDWMHLPIIRLNSGDPLNIGFDDMTHQERRLRYDIQLLNHDFTPNDELFKSEYLSGVTDQLYIDNLNESLGTAKLYTHYSLAIPNSDVRIKLSGNYLLSIYDDNSDDQSPLVEIYFMVTDQSMTSSISYETNTDIDVNKTHQQVLLTLNNTSEVTDPDRQLHTVILQNNRWSSAVYDAPWDLRTAKSLSWQHCKQYIFLAGNEQHKFEYLDLHRNSLGVAETGFDGKNYHVYVQTDVPRPNYVYDQSGQGAFIIRNTDNTDDEDYTTEYFMAHFTCSPNAPIGAKDKPSGDNSTLYPQNSRLYIDGLWTRGSLSPEYELTYNPATNLYETTVALKMGYYSYRYIIQHSDGTTELAPFEGNYYETQNTYQALIYFRPVGGRSDLLVSYATTN